VARAWPAKTEKTLAARQEPKCDRAAVTDEVDGGLLEQRDALFPGKNKTYFVKRGTIHPARLMEGAHKQGRVYKTEATALVSESSAKEICGEREE